VGSTVLPPNSRDTDGLRAPTTDYRPTAADYGTPKEAVAAHPVRSHRGRTTKSDSEGRAGRSLEETDSPGNQRGPATGTARHDPEPTAIWRGSLWFEDAVCECFDTSSQSIPSGSPGSRRQRPAISRLTGLLRVRLTQLTGWIAQLRMDIRHKSSSFPDEQSKMRPAFNRLRGVALGQILPHVREDGTIGLENLLAFIQLLEAACGDPDQVATAGQTMWEVNQKNREFSQYYAEFQVIAADVNWNPSAWQNALRLGLSEEMKDSFTYSDMPKDLPAFLTVSQKRDN
jgi:hypothetical protein